MNPMPEEFVFEVVRPVYLLNTLRACNKTLPEVSHDQMFRLGSAQAMGLRSLGYEGNGSR
jgi:hypothetical protein